MLFSTGVPVSAQPRRRARPRTTSLVVLPRFLIRCDFIQHHEIEGDRPAVVAAFQDITVANQQLIVGDAHRNVRQPPLPGSTRLVPFDRQRRHLRSPELEFPPPIRHQRLGAHHKHAANFAAAKQEPNRGDRLHCFAEPHFVGQDCRVARIEKSHALELKWERLKRHGQFAIGQQRLQRRLQKIMQAVFQFDDILGRPDAQCIRRTARDDSESRLSYRL